MRAAVLAILLAASAAEARQPRRDPPLLFLTCPVCNQAGQCNTWEYLIDFGRRTVDKIPAEITVIGPQGAVRGEC